MSLHGKFRFLLAIFGISVVANVLVSVWCIHIYMGEATNRFQLLMFSARDTEEIRRLLDDLTAELRERGQRDSGLHDTRYRHLHEKIAARIAELRVEKDDTDQNDVRRRLGKLATHLSQACDRYVDLLNNTRRAEAEALLTGEIIPRYLEPLDRRLS